MALWASSHISLAILINNYFIFFPHFFTSMSRNVMKTNSWKKKMLLYWKFLVNFKTPVVTRLVFGKGQSSGLDLSMAASLLSSAGFIWRSWIELNVATMPLTHAAYSSVCLAKLICLIPSWKLVWNPIHK